MAESSDEYHWFTYRWPTKQLRNVGIEREAAVAKNAATDAGMGSRESQASDGIGAPVRTDQSICSGPADQHNQQDDNGSPHGR